MRSTDHRILPQSQILEYFKDFAIDKPDIVWEDSDIMWEQLKDAEFKKKIKEELPKSLSRSNLFGSDFEIDLGDHKILLEYENSSRGLTSNLGRTYCKFLELKNFEVTVFFIRTSTHKKKHNRDYLNFRAFSDLIKEKHPKFRVLCYGPEDFSWLNILKDIIKEDL